MVAVKIRRAGALDAESLTDLVQTSGAYRGRYASIIDGYRVTPDYLSLHQVFTAVDEAGRSLGFYALILESAELDLMFVADDAQGRGIGRMLIEHMILQAAEAGLAEVRVVSHPPSVEFYERMGAKRTGVVPPSPPTVTWERPHLRFAVP
ncbi:GNAT family N-acetyltransferase [Glycomyces sp. L485]|uniref:GNAT family N-acetyltransferase n=1 Tax=Glycomyces sp. L485 TaxID=2909235 RepID=UPI001F4AE61A|nr:GNAT family N-acetyltransferase [Glycomyces sp. L485]MCH7232705.1 GNAT family N-acetyltransferase [Glycomyces sp. L485]